MSLSSLVSEHRRQRETRKEQETARLERSVAASVDALSKSLVGEMNETVADAFVRQRRVERSATKLCSSLSTFSSDAEKWLKLYDDFNGALLELGDAQNWARGINTHLTRILEVLQEADPSHLVGVTESSSGEASSQA
ncbi:MAG: hypothetical protein MHM6MM_005805 [Cercozoa sp. M6MM]